MKVIHKLESYPTGDMVVPYCPNCNEPTYDEPNCPFCNTKLEYGNNIDLQQEIERLNNIINKGIEYIEERYNGEVLTHTFDKCNVGELLNILKGSDKE